MNKLLPAVAASVLAACFALPLNAMPIVVPKAVAVHTSDVEQVKHRRHGNGHAYGHWKKRRYASRDCRVLRLVLPSAVLSRALRLSRLFPLSPSVGV